MACDGIWDCLTSQDVVDYFIDENVADPDVDAALVCENLCQSIVSPTLQVIGSDNLTLMVIVLK
jgi:serine/threonine protein phosphatase PrpC